MTRGGRRASFSGVAERRPLEAEVMRPASPRCGLQKREKLIGGLDRLCVDLAAGEPEHIQPECPQCAISLPVSFEPRSSLHASEAHRTPRQVVDRFQKDFVIPDPLGVTVQASLGTV